MLLVASVCAAGEPSVPLAEAGRLYQELEFDAALQAVHRAKLEPGLSPVAQRDAYLLEGLVSAQLGKTEAARGAFSRALGLDLQSQLPFKASPKISLMFEEERQRQTLEAKPSAPPLPTQSLTVATLDDRPLAAAPRPSRRWSIGAGAVSGLGLVGGVGLGLIASGASRELRTQTHSGAEAQRLHDRAGGSARAANLSYGVAALAGATALVAYLLEGPSPTAIDTGSPR